MKKNKMFGMIAAGVLVVCAITCICVVAMRNNFDIGASETESEEDGAAEVTAERTPLPEVASVDMDIDYEKQVKKLCDYKGLKLTITGKYEVTEEELNELILSELSGCGADLIEITDRTEVKKDDIVNVDYSGVVDGVSLEKGSAEDQYIDIAENRGYIGLNPFVDGFSDPMIGAQVGDTVRGDVTFPDDYSNNKDLSGKTVTFSYKINAIYEKCTDLSKIESIAGEENNRVDKMINEWYSKYNVTNYRELVDFVKSYVSSQLSVQKSNDITTQVRDYMSKNCEVEVPEDYLEARVAEYFVSFERSSLKPDQSLADYLRDNDPTRTVDELWETERKSLKERISLEFIFRLIAEKENIKVDKEELGKYVEELLSSNNLGFQSEDEIYDFLGAGNKDNGKKYVENQYIVNKAVLFVGGEADVTVEEPEEETVSGE